MITFPDPLRVADATFLIRPLLQVPGAPTAMHLNSMVIVGAQPVIVDTGPAIGRAAWCEQVFGLVDPEDVRWVFLSHDDCDHAGNLAVVMEQCRHATLVTGYGDHRMCADAAMPGGRQRRIGDGERIPIGDRDLVALRPPVFDSPTTRGLFDPSTGVYWASDAFGSPVTEVVDHADQLPAAEWSARCDEFAMRLSPWLSVADPVRFGRWVDRLAIASPSVIVGAHGPMLSGPTLDAAVAGLRRLPGRPEPASATHDVLRETLALLEPA